MRLEGRTAVITGEAVVRGVERRRPRVLVGPDARVLSLIVRALPASYWKVLALRAGK